MKNNNNDNILTYNNDTNHNTYGINYNDNNVTNQTVGSYNSQTAGNYYMNNNNMINGQYHNQNVASSISSVTNKTTVYLGNLKDNITKQQIQSELATVNPAWKTLTIRLNLRSGWSHAFIDFEHIADAKKLIYLWHNKPNSLLTNTRLRCEISKRQMI